MPSIANQDFKIYGQLGNNDGISGKYCAELYAGVRRVLMAMVPAQETSLADAFVYDSNKYIIRQFGAGKYIDTAGGESVEVMPSHADPAYYDALWAIQQAIYAFDGTVAEDDLEFEIVDGYLRESGYGFTFVNEDGYFIKGTAADGKLTSLYLGEKTNDARPIVRLESLLPLVGELPLDTTKIW